MKVGELLTMYFHGAGVTSEEQLTIRKITPKKVCLQRDEDGRTWDFDRKTGHCLNDVTDFGFRRTVKPC